MKGIKKILSITLASALIFGFQGQPFGKTGSALLQAARYQL